MVSENVMYSGECGSVLPFHFHPIWKRLGISFLMACHGLCLDVLPQSHAVTGVNFTK